MKAIIKSGLLIFLGIFLSRFSNAQAPNITYSPASSNLPVGAPFSVSPTNTGGTVPATTYAQVTTIAGSVFGTSGYTNATGTAARFNQPQAVVEDASGNLYIADALNNAIRKITNTGVVTTFAGSTTGASGFTNGTGTAALFNAPTGLAIDGSGNLYVSDNGNGAIRKITSTAVVTTFYSTTGTFGPTGLSFDASGNLLVALQTANHIVKISPSGVLTSFAGSTTSGYVNGAASSSRFYNPKDAKVDASGNVFVADYLNNAIREVNTSAIVSTFAGSTVNGNTGSFANGVGTAARFNFPTGVVFTSGGVIYVAERNNNDIRRIMPDATVTLTAGSATQTSGNSDGIGTAAQFSSPGNIYVDGTGTGYITEVGGNRVRKIVLTGYDLKGTLPAGLTFDPTTGTISGTPTGSTGTVTDTITACNASGYSVAIVTLSVVSATTAPVIAYSPATNNLIAGIPFTISPTNSGGPIPASVYGQVVLLAGSSSGTGGYTNATGTAARFNGPQGVTGDASANTYLGDANNNAIRKVTPTGVTTTFAGSLTGASGSTNGTGTAALFNAPCGIAVDGSGNQYVCDYSNGSIRKITPAGVVTTFYHNAGAFGPSGACFDSSGNLMVVAQDANQIWKITSSAVQSVFVGSTGGYVNATGTSAKFQSPTDIRVDASGNFYVADYLNNAIRKITSAGVVTTFAGSNVPGNSGGYANGVGTAAKFNNPTSLAVDGGGIVYVTDFLNHDIRRIMPDGTVTLTAGSATQVAGNSDGTGTAAGFNQPDAMYIDGTGNGYIAELNGNRVRKIVLTGYTISGTLPAGLSFDPTTGIISGTPSAPVTSQMVTVTGFNAAGYSSTTVSFTVTIPNNQFNWTGGESSEWTNPENWSSGTVPGSSDQALIGLVPFTNQPAVNSNIQVGNILFGGPVAVNLTVNSGNTLQVNGSMIQSHSSDNTIPATTLLGNGSIVCNAIAVGNNILSKVVGVKNTVFTSKVASLTVSDSLVVTSATIDLLSGGVANNNATFSLEGGTLTVAGHIKLDNFVPSYMDSIPPLKPLAKFVINISSSLNATLAISDSALFVVKHRMLDSIDFYHYTSGTGKSIVSYQGANQLVYTNNSISVDTTSYTYQDLSISGTGVKVAGNNSTGNVFSVGGDLSITGGTLDMNAFLAYATVYGNFSNTAGLHLGYPGINFKGATFYNSGMLRDTTANVSFSGSTQTLTDATTTGGTNFDRVSFANTGTKTIQSGTFAVIPKGKLSLSNNAILTVGSSGTLILRSDSTGTASVTPIPSGSTLTGIVNAEWFVQGSLTSTLMRTYRPVSPPVNHTGNTNGTGYYNFNWIKGTTNFNGAFILGPNGVTAGFDTVGNPSIFIYREDVDTSEAGFTTGNFRGVNRIDPTGNDLGTQARFTVTPVADTTINLPIANGAWFFYRGNRVKSNGTTAGTKISPPYNYPESVIFTDKGTVNQGQVQVKVYFRSDNYLSYTKSPAITNGTSKGFNLVGNPYPSGLNWDNFSATDSTASIYGPGLQGKITFYDPVSKEFQTYTADPSHNRNQVYPGSGSAASNVIASGEAFFVQVDSTSANRYTAQLRFREAAKFNPPDTSHSMMMLRARTTLLKSTATPAKNLNSHRKVVTGPGELVIHLSPADKPNTSDHILIRFSNTAVYGYRRFEDVLKPETSPGQTVTLLSWSANHKALSVNTIPLPVHSASVGLQVAALQSGNYNLSVDKIQNVPTGYLLRIKDRLTGKLQDIRKQPNYTFKITKSNKTTYGDRFELVITRTGK